jgi:hypothetical protein
MSLQSSQVWVGTFTVGSPQTGAQVAADSLPTGLLRLNGVDNGAPVTITAQATSGEYDFSVTLPTLTAGQHVELLITATVGGITRAGVVAEGYADNLVSALNNLSSSGAQSACAAALTAYGASTYAGGDTPGTTTLLTRVTGAVMLAASYTAPPTTAAIATAVAGALNNLSSAQVQSACAAALTAAALATYSQVAGLNNLSSAEVTSAVEAALAAVGVTLTSEEQTALVSAVQSGLATAAQISALNNLSASQAQSAVSAALTAYGVATLGGGPNAVTVTVQTSAGPVAGAVVGVQNEAGTATIAGPWLTNAEGQIPFALADGVYQLLVLSTTLYAPFAPQRVTVSGATPVTLTLEAATLPAPASPTDCYVYVDLPDVVGTPEITFTLSGPAGAGSALFTAAQQAMTRSATTAGRWGLDLPQGQSYLCTAVPCGVRDQLVTIPAQTSAELTLLLGLN